MLNLYREIKNLNKKVNNHYFKLCNKKKLPASSDVLKLFKENQYYYGKLNKLKNKCKKYDYSTYMLTLSIPHKINDSLQDLTENLEIALNNFLLSDKWKAFAEYIDLKHIIIKFEIDFSDSYGFNPHYHIIIIAKVKLDKEYVDYFGKKLKNCYFKECISTNFKNKLTWTQRNWALNEKYKDNANAEHKGHILCLQNNFSYLSYIADNRKLLRQKYSNLKDKSYSVYQLLLNYDENINYDDKFLEYVNLMTRRSHQGNKPNFKVSTYIVGIPFDDSLLKESDIEEPNLDFIENLEPKRLNKFYNNLLFLPEKMLQHYGLLSYIERCEKRINGKDRAFAKKHFDIFYLFKRFKLYLAFYCPPKFWLNFYNYVKENVDNNLFKGYYDSKPPTIIVKLVDKYLKWVENLRGYEEYIGLSSVFSDRDFITIVNNEKIDKDGEITLVKGTYRDIHNAFRYKINKIDEFLILPVNDFIKKYTNNQKNL